MIECPQYQAVGKTGSMMQCTLLPLVGLSGPNSPKYACGECRKHWVDRAYPTKVEGNPFLESKVQVQLPPKTVTVEQSLVLVRQPVSKTSRAPRRALRPECLHLGKLLERLRSGCYKTCKRECLSAEAKRLGINNGTTTLLLCEHCSVYEEA